MLENVSVVVATVSGEVCTEPVVLNSYGNNVIKRVKIRVKRNSGAYDSFYVNYTQNVTLTVGSFVHIIGDIRTLNNENNGFVVEGFIFAKELTILDSEPEVYENSIKIENAIIDKVTDVRKSYDFSDRYVATYKIKLGRKHGRVSTFSVTTWGSSTKVIRGCSSGTVINLEGRLQEYISKKTNRLYLCIVTYKLSIEGGE